MRDFRAERSFACEALTPGPSPGGRGETCGFGLAAFHR